MLSYENSFLPTLNVCGTVFQGWTGLGRGPIVREILVLVSSLVVEKIPPSRLFDGLPQSGP